MQLNVMCNWNGIEYHVCDVGGQLRLCAASSKQGVGLPQSQSQHMFCSLACHLSNKWNKCSS